MDDIREKINALLNRRESIEGINAFWKNQYEVKCRNVEAAKKELARKESELKWVQKREAEIKRYDDELKKVLATRKPPNPNPYESFDKVRAVIEQTTVDSRIQLDNSRSILKSLNKTKQLYDEQFVDWKKKADDERETIQILKDTLEAAKLYRDALREERQDRKRYVRVELTNKNQDIGMATKLNENVELDPIYEHLHKTKKADLSNQPILRINHEDSMILGAKRLNANRKCPYSAQDKESITSNVQDNKHPTFHFKGQGSLIVNSKQSRSSSSSIVKSTQKENCLSKGVDQSVPIENRKKSCPSSSLMAKSNQEQDHLSKNIDQNVLSDNCKQTLSSSSSKAKPNQEQNHLSKDVDQNVLSDNRDQNRSSDTESTQKESHLSKETGQNASICIIEETQLSSSSISKPTQKQTYSFKSTDQNALIANCKQNRLLSSSISKPIQKQGHLPQNVDLDASIYIIEETQSSSFSSVASNQKQRNLSHSVTQSSSSVAPAKKKIETLDFSSELSSSTNSISTLVKKDPNAYKPISCKKPVEVITISDDDEIEIIGEKPGKNANSSDSKNHGNDNDEYDALEESEQLNQTLDMESTSNNFFAFDTTFMMSSKFDSKEHEKGIEDFYNNLFNDSKSNQDA